MTISFGEFIYQLFHNPVFLVITILVLGVITVNGGTDAPNAIATCVSTRALPPKTSIIMAAVFNFLGVLVMTWISAGVAQTIYNLVDFGGDSHLAVVALAAAMISVVMWSSMSWILGLPISESHALIAGLSGAGISLQNSFKVLNLAEWSKVIYGIIFSVLFGFLFGWIFVRIITHLFKRVERQKATKFFTQAQIAGAAGMAFMHGAQDGQKFMGVFMLGALLAQGQTGAEQFIIPLWMMIISSAAMAFGTSVGGYRIIKSVGVKMVKLDKYQGFAADLAGIVSLLITTLLGIPVSTTHTKTTAIMGVGAAKGLNKVNWNIVKEMSYSWILVFPGCGLLGYLMANIFIRLF